MLLPLVHLSGSLSSDSFCSHISDSLHLSLPTCGLSLDMPPCESPALFSLILSLSPGLSASLSALLCLFFFLSLDHFLTVYISIHPSIFPVLYLSLSPYIPVSLILLYFSNSHSLYPFPLPFPPLRTCPGVDNINHSGLGWH